MRRTGVLVEDVVNLRFDLGRRKPRGGNGTGPPCVAHAQLLKLQESGLFPDEPAKIKCTQAHSEGGQRCWQQQKVTNKALYCNLAYLWFICSRIKKRREPRVTVVHA